MTPLRVLIDVIAGLLPVALWATFRASPPVQRLVLTVFTAAVLVFCGVAVLHWLRSIRRDQRDE